MDYDNSEIVYLELKYCETCGGLWLRLMGSTQTECAACLASPRWRSKNRGKITRPRMPVAQEKDIKAESRVTARRTLKTSRGRA